MSIEMKNKILNLEFRQTLNVPDKLFWGYYKQINPNTTKLVETTRINCDLDITSFNFQVLFNSFELGTWKRVALPKTTNNKIYEKR